MRRTTLRWCSMLLPIIIYLSGLSAVATPLPQSLIALSAPKGIALVSSARSQHNLYRLLQQYTTQKTQAYCGVASAVMVLNALHIKAPVTAVTYPYRYFNQDNIFTLAVLKLYLSPALVNARGLTLDQVAALLRTFHVNVSVYHVTASDQARLKRLLVKQMLLPNHYVIVNFSRKSLQQPGGGHFSPVAAYNAKQHALLMLDVARYKYNVYWVPIDKLFNAMATPDSAENKNRGFVIIHA